jgi:DNA-binding MarR family transcriptional regulator
MEFVVGQYGAFLATRSSARVARTNLEDKIETRPDSQTLIIDLAGVNAMTISFADEFLGRFYSSLAAGDIRPISVLLVGLNDETTEALTICFQRRELVAAAQTQDQRVLLAAPEFLVETYQKALRLHQFKANELATSLGITPQNANNRLKRLVAAGTINRQLTTATDRGGKEFSYTMPALHAPADI